MTTSLDDDDDGGGGGGGWRQRDLVPRPDPTKLTNEAIDRVTVQYRRELLQLQAILEARLDAMDKATSVLDLTVNRTPTVIQTAISGVREVYDERFDSLHQQLIDRDERFAQVATSRDTALKAALDAARESLTEQAAVAERAVANAEATFRLALADMRDIYDERFRSVAQQFSERDVRTDQAATASASALAAALQAAKEAVFEQAQAAAKAAEKTELSFTKQIDQIQLQIKTIGDGFSDRIGELKERIDRGEGSESGASAQVIEHRAGAAGTNQVIIMGIMIISVLVAIGALVGLILKHLHP